MAKKCEREDCNNPVFSKGFCKWHYTKTKKKPSKKITGEKIMFEMIYEERPHISFVSGLHVDCIAHNFAHVIPKGVYPKFRLLKENVVFLTPEEHHLYDFGTEQDRIDYKERMKRDGVDVDWNKLYELKDRLIEKYQQF